MKRVIAKVKRFKKNLIIETYFTDSIFHIQPEFIIWNFSLKFFYQAATKLLIKSESEYNFFLNY